MTEVVRYSAIGKQDLRIGTGTFEIRLGDGRVVILDEIRLTDFLSALTAGSVLFVKATGVAGEDNANFFWDDTNNRLGIGTSSPGTPLHVIGAILGATIGPSVSQQHTLPAVASDTIVLLAATQTLTGKTLSGAVVSGAAPATPTANVLYADSVVKGWVRFDGTGTPAIADDLNVSSITDNGVGDYTVNWATAFATVNYAVAASCLGVTNGVVTIATKLAGSVRINVFNSATGALADSSDVSVIAIGDQ